MPEIPAAEGQSSLSDKRPPLPIIPEPVLNRSIAVSSDDSLQTGDRFTAVTYNIEADFHIRDETFHYGDALEAVIAEVPRHKRILRELEYLDGDVVALQEVGTEIWTSLVKPAMEELGYSGYFLPRRQQPEGVALFYKTSVFQKLSSSSVYLEDVVTDEMCPSLGLSPSVAELVKKYIYTNGRPLIVMNLKHVTSGRRVTVATIHLSWTTYLHNDVNALETAAALQHTLSQRDGDDSPFIVMGDFNQECQMPACVYMREGDFNTENVAEMMRLKYLRPDDRQWTTLLDIMPGAFTHSEKIGSAYAAVAGEEPFGSSVDLQNKFQLFSTVDYVYYSSNFLTPTRAWNLHPPEVTGLHGLPPDVNFPSDHMSLKAEFAFPADRKADEETKEDSDVSVEM